MDKPAGEKLQPAGVLARFTAFSAANQTLDVQFETGLDKREISGPETGFHFTLKYLKKQEFHYADQVCDGNIALNHQTLKLIERVIMICIDRFITVASAGSDHTGRSAVLFKRPDLNRGCVSPEDHAVF